MEEIRMSKIEAKIEKILNLYDEQEKDFIEIESKTEAYHKRLHLLEEDKQSILKDISDFRDTIKDTNNLIIGYVKDGVKINGLMDNIKILMGFMEEIKEEIKNKKLTRVEWWKIVASNIIAGIFGFLCAIVGGRK